MGLKYIIPCQSLFSQKSIDELIKTEYERISTIVKNCLGNKAMSITDQRAKQAFPELQSIIQDIYSKPLSSKQRKRARYGYRKIQHLQKLLRSRPDIIICRMDKSPGFYIGNAATIAAKALEYMNKTEAYEEITNGRCPLADNLRAIQNLLDYLFNKKAITKAQRAKLLPDLDKLELAHLHVLPKVHKVKFFSRFFFFRYIYSVSLLFTDEHTSTTYTCRYICTNGINVKIFK